MLQDILSPETLDRMMNVGQIAGIKLAAALATFFIGRWIAKLLIAGVKQGMVRARADATLANFLGNVLYGLMMAIIVVSALGQLGVNTTSAAALLGGAGVAIGLSLKDQLSSFAAGVMLIMFRPFSRGDFVEAGGVSGTVEEVKIVATVFKTPNNQEVTVPNHKIWGDTITNYSIRPQRRIDMPVGISYESNIKQAREILAGLASEDERVLELPETWIGVTELADSAIIITFRPWVATKDYWQVRSDLMERVKVEFDAAGIGIPFPQMDVHLNSAAPSSN
ncbi:MAG: mechanosensitive ion channel family protein [Oceanococcus sp.]